MSYEAFALFMMVPILAVSIGMAGVLGWIYTTWLRVKNGYPLEGKDGQSVYPGATTETIERVKLLTSENAQLRAELGAVKDRLATVERIVTDRSYSLENEIERLRIPAN